MALFGKAKENTPLPPVAAWEYRCGDGRYWGFHYRLSRREGKSWLSYSRVMPERVESIPVPETLWEQLAALGSEYGVLQWAGFERRRPRTDRTKRWLLYITFEDGTDLRAEGCGAAPARHEQWEDAFLTLLNSHIDL